MLADISLRQFHEWRAYADLEPFDEVRADLRTAHIVQTLLNLEFVRNRKAAKVKLADCALRFGDDAVEEPTQSPEAARREIRRTMQMLVAIYNEPPPKPEKKKRKRRGKQGA